MTFSRAVTFLGVFLIASFPRPSETRSDLGTSDDTSRSGRSLEKRSVLTFPPSSSFQINMGITLSGQFERNSGIVVLAFQQNAPLPSESEPFLLPAVVGRKFSIFDHLQDVLTSYGFNGPECLRKMVCQIGEAPLLGGLMEDVITFVLSPSAHRSVRVGDVRLRGEENDFLDLLLESERLGKLGGNCSFAFPGCVQTPLDLISAFVRV